MKKSIWLLSLLLTVTLYSGCGKKDDPASNKSGTTNSYQTPSSSPTPIPPPPVNYNGDNTNTTGNPVLQPPPPPPPPSNSKPTGPIVMCSCYDLETKKLLWKRKLRKSECERLCPLEYPNVQ